MGFAAVARHGAALGRAYAVRDGIVFGLEPRGELEVGTTLCNEIRMSGQVEVASTPAETRFAFRMPLR